MSESLKPMFRKIVQCFTALVITVFVCNINAIAAPDGKAIFQSNCASCHNPLKDATGPALKGVDGRVPSKEWIHNWVHGSAKVIATGDKYANDLFNKWNKTAMTAFPQLSNEEIDAVVTYVNSVEPPKPGGDVAASGATQPQGTDSTTNWIYTLITVILLTLAFILWRGKQRPEACCQRKRWHT